MAAADAAAHTVAMGSLAALYIHPVKSCAPLAIDAAEVRARGLRHDRRWMVVDADGGFLSGRQHPRLTLLRARPSGDALVLDAPAMPTFTLAPPLPSRRCEVVVWKARVDALDCGDAVAAWLQSFLGCAARLVHMDARAVRGIGGDPAAGALGFADTAPLLLVSQAALDGLNARLATPVSMLRFRPNAVIDGVAAHAEDDWRRLRIGAVEFDALKRCTRCVFTTVDPARGVADRGGEPLRTLGGYRRGGKGIEFGLLLVPQGTGVLRIGDPVEVLE